MTETNKFENLFDNNTSSGIAFSLSPLTEAGKLRTSPLPIIKMTKRNSSFSEKQNR